MGVGTRKAGDVGPEDQRTRRGQGWIQYRDWAAGGDAGIEATGHLTGRPSREDPWRSAAGSSDLDQQQGVRAIAAIEAEAVRQCRRRGACECRDHRPRAGCDCHRAGG